MVISGLYIYVVASVSVYYILGYDVPACGSRVPFIYSVHVYLHFLSMLWLDVSCLGAGLVWPILIFICIIEGWDWPGVGIWRSYMY